MMKALRWNSHWLWSVIWLTLFVGAIIAFRMNFRTEGLILLDCGVCCTLIERNFVDLASEAKESQKPLLEQERELIRAFKVQAICCLLLLTVPLWLTTNWSMWLMPMYFLALLPFQLLRRIHRLRRVRRELRDQSTLTLF